MQTRIKRFYCQLMIQVITNLVPRAFSLLFGWCEKEALVTSGRLRYLIGGTDFVIKFVIMRFSQNFTIYA